MGQEKAPEVQAAVRFWKLFALVGVLAAIVALLGGMVLRLSDGALADELISWGPIAFGMSPCVGLLIGVIAVRDIGQRSAFSGLLMVLVAIFQLGMAIAS